MLLGGEVTILADKPLYGVVSPACRRICSKQASRTMPSPIDQMAIDTGLLDAKSRIRVGTPIVFARSSRSTGGRSALQQVP